jgi:hypothetical protein
MWTLIVGVAVAKDLDPAELPNTASTLDQGDVDLHVWAPSNFAVHDQVQLDTNIPQLAFGPQLTVEAAVYDTDDLQVAVEPMLVADWGFNDLLVGGSGVVSTMLSETVRFNGSLGVTYASLSIPEESEPEEPPTTGEVEVGDPGEGSTQTYGGSMGSFLVQFAAGNKNGVGLPLTLGVDIVSSDQMTWQIIGRTGLLTYGDDTPVFSGGRAVGTRRAALGSCRAGHRGHAAADPALAEGHRGSDRRRRLGSQDFFPYPTSTSGGGSNGDLHEQHVRPESRARSRCCRPRAAPRSTSATSRTRSSRSW